MKKSAIISSHLILWVIFTLMVIAQSKLFLEAKPDAPFGSHFAYVVFLEMVMGMIFFYLTFFTLPWGRSRCPQPCLLLLQPGYACKVLPSCPMQLLLITLHRHHPCIWLRKHASTGRKIRCSACGNWRTRPAVMGAKVVSAGMPAGRSRCPPYRSS